MATNIGDFVANIRADTSEFVSGIKDARGEMYLFNTGIRNDWKEARQDAWKAATGIKAGADRSVSALQRLKETVGGQLTPELAVAAEAMAEVSTESEESSSAVGRLSSMVANAAVAAKVAVTAWIAYELVIKEAAAAVGEHLKKGADLRTSFENAASSGLNAAKSIGGVFVSSIHAAFNAVLQFTTGFDSITSVVDAAASSLTSMARVAESTFTSIKSYAQDAAVTFSTALAIWHGADSGQAAAFYEEGVALNKLAEETNAVIAKQEEQRSSFQFLRKVQEDATASTQRAAEVAKVSSLLTVDAVEQEMRSLQQRSAQTILNGQADDNWRKQTEALFNALEKQREGIKNGTIIDKEAEAAKRAAAQQAEEAARKQQALNDQGIDRIARLRDQIDLLNGSATEAQIAMREMSRAGFAQEQIDEVGRLTEELNRLKQEAKADGKGDDPMKAKRQREIDTGPAAVLKGSASALSAIFGAGRKTDDRTAKATETTVAELKKLNNNVLKLNGGPQIVGGGKL